MEGNFFKIQIAANYIPALALLLAMGFYGEQYSLSLQLGVPILALLLGFYLNSHTKKRWVEKFPPVLERRGRFWCLFTAMLALGAGSAFCTINQKHVQGSDEKYVVQDVGKGGGVISSEIMSGDELNRNSEMKGLRAGFFFIFFGAFLLRWFIQDEICARRLEGKLN